MSELTGTLENLIEQATEAREELGKFTNGNSSAGTRVRKHMQNIKDLAQQVRLEVQSIKNA